MFNIEKFDESSYEYYKFIVDFVNTSKKGIGEYYYFKYNGKDFILCKINGGYTVIDFCQEEGKIVLINFLYDPVQDLLTLIYGDSYYTIHYSDGLEAYIDENGIYHGISVLSKIHKEFKNAYDGKAFYSQTNFNTDINLVMSYNHNFVPGNDIQQIYDFRLEHPLEVFIRKHAVRLVNKQLSYNNGIVYKRVDLQDTNSKLLLYYALIKKYGLQKVLNERLDVLLMEKCSKYYRAYNGKIIPGISKELSEEEMMQLVEKYGFRSKVPSELIKFHNRSGFDFSYFRDLALEVMELEASMKLQRNKEEN